MRLPNLSALSLYAPTSADASGVADGDREDRPILLDDSDDEVVVLSEDDGNDTEPGEDSGNDTEIGEDDNDYPVAPGVTVVEGVEVENDGWFQMNEDQKRELLKREKQEAADEGRSRWYEGHEFPSREDRDAFLEMEEEFEQARERAKPSNKERKKPMKKFSRLGGLGRTATPKPKEPDTSAVDKEAALKKEARNAKRRAQYAAKKARAAAQADASRPEVPQEDASRPEVPQEDASRSEVPQEVVEL